MVEKLHKLERKTKSNCSAVCMLAVYVCLANKGSLQHITCRKRRRNRNKKLSNQNLITPAFVARTRMSHYDVAYLHEKEKQLSDPMTTSWVINGVLAEVEDIPDDRRDDTPDGTKLELQSCPFHDDAAILANIFSTAVKSIALLNISNCRLTSIPNSIDRLVNLQRLWIDKNRLEALPRSIGRLKRLTHLSAYRNKLSWLPTEFRRLDDLLVLRLGGNQFGDGGLSVVARMRSLEELYLKNNKFMTVIPRKIARKRSLRLLHVGRNKIEEPRVEVIDGEMDMDDVRRYAREYDW